MPITLNQFMSMTHEQHEEYDRKVYGIGPSRVQLKERLDDEFFLTLGEIIETGSYPEITFKITLD